MKIDVIAGIPSYNNQNTISYVTEQIGKTFEKLKQNSIIADCDGGSKDDTLKNFLSSKTKIKKIIIKAKPGTTGKGTVFKNLFSYARTTTAKTIIVNDSDLRSINPKWVNLQLQAIKKYDYATPLYSRYKYDGTITNNICYPLVYSLFCKNIRQPIGGDFAFSKRLSNYWLKCRWPANAKLFGIDIFMTTNAILGNFKICKVNLGAKIHDAKDPSHSLSPMFRQVIGTLFEIIIKNKNIIKKLKQVKQIPVLGGKKLKKPQTFKVDNNNIKKKFTQGLKINNKTIKKILDKENFKKINKGINAELWSNIVYDYIIAYKKDKNIIESLIPLWFGRIHSFVNETINLTTEQAEKNILKQAKIFYKNRNYLLERL